MYNHPPVNVMDGPCLCNVVYFQFVALFLITLLELNLDLYLVHLL